VLLMELVTDANGDAAGNNHAQRMLLRMQNNAATLH